MVGRTPVGGRTLLLALLALALLRWASTPLWAQEEGCTLAPGFWKAHPGAWPVTELTIDGSTYTQDELIELLETPRKETPVSSSRTQSLRRCSMWRSGRRCRPLWRRHWTPRRPG